MRLDRRRVRWAWIGLAVLLACPGLAEAHKLKVFASVDGGWIRGYVYTPSGRMEGVQVVARDGSGAVLAEVVTGAEGAFEFPVGRRCEHILTAELGDGHSGAWTVTADEIGGATASAAAGAGASGAAGDAGGGGDGSRLEALVDRAVERRVRPLREEVDALASQERLRDLLGGLGYIAGVFGVLMYCKARGVQRVER